MSKSKAKSGIAKYSWGILLGMAAFPILALMSKAFPTLNTLWLGLCVVFALLTIRSLIGLLMPRSKKPAAAEHDALHRAV